MKIFYIISAFIALFLIGFIIPNLVKHETLEPELYADLRQAIGNGIFFMTEKVISNKDGQYPNHCGNEKKQILIQTYTWMMIPRSVIEACIVQDTNNKTLYNRIYGDIKKGR